MSFQGTCPPIDFVYFLKGQAQTKNMKKIVDFILAS